MALVITRYIRLNPVAGISYHIGNAMDSRLRGNDKRDNGFHGLLLHQEAMRTIP